MNDSIEICISHLQGPGIASDEVSQPFKHLASMHATSKENEVLMGCAGCLLLYEGFADLVVMGVPKMRGLKSRMYLWDWRAKPVSGNTIKRAYMHRR